MARNSHANANFCSVGRLCFVGAEVSGRFYMGGAHLFKSPDQLHGSRKYTYALDLAEAKIGLNLLLNDHLISFGAIRLSRCQVGGQLILSSSKIFRFGKDYYAINARNISVERELRIKSRALIIGLCDFQNATIGSNVDISGSIFCSESAITSECSIIDKSLTFKKLNLLNISQEEATPKVLSFQYRDRNKYRKIAEAKEWLKKHPKSVDIRMIRSSIFESVGALENFRKANIINEQLKEKLPNKRTSLNEEQDFRALDFDNSEIAGNLYIYPGGYKPGGSKKTTPAIIIGKVFINRSMIDGALDIRGRDLNNLLEDYTKNENLRTDNEIAGEFYFDVAVKQLQKIKDWKNKKHDSGFTYNLYLDNTTVTVLRENALKYPTSIISCKGLEFRTLDCKNRTEFEHWAEFIDRTHYGSSGSMWLPNKIVHYHKTKETGTDHLTLKKHTLALNCLSKHLRTDSDHRRFSIFISKFLISICGFILLMHPRENLNFYTTCLWWAGFLIMLLWYSIKCRYLAKVCNSYLSRNTNKTPKLLEQKFLINIFHPKRFLYAAIDYGKGPLSILIIILFIGLLGSPSYTPEHNENEKFTDQNLALYSFSESLTSLMPTSSSSKTISPGAFSIDKTRNTITRTLYPLIGWFLLGLIGLLIAVKVQ